MIVSYKDGCKLVGISVVCACAVFVCTFFLNYYLDIAPLRSRVPAESLPIYRAQLSTAKAVCGITGGFLAAIAIVMLTFYIRLYIDGHRKALGICKAFGYSNGRIARDFAVFGLSVLVGCAVGYLIALACMPALYRTQAVDGLPISPRYHVGLLFALVFAPSLVAGALSVAYASLVLRTPALQLIRGTQSPAKIRKSKLSDKPFLRQMCGATLRSRKTLVFFVAFSCFCFAAMLQMGMSMRTLASAVMGGIILAIGVLLAVVSMAMAMTSLLKHNAAPLALMKALGFSARERFLSVFGGFLPFCLLGFALGTVYQYALLLIMVRVVFRDIGTLPAYSFDVPAFFLTLALFLLSYAAAFALFALKANRTSLRETMSEI